MVLLILFKWNIVLAFYLIKAADFDVVPIGISGSTYIYIQIGEVLREVLHYISFSCNDQQMVLLD